MVYYVHKGTTKRDIRISDQDYAQLVRQQEIIEQVDHIFAALDTVNHTVLQMINAHLSLLASMPNMGGFSVRNEYEYIKQANMRLSSFLSAFRLYLDSGEAVLSDLSESLLERFKASKKAENTHIYYKIGCQLRNYIQHYRFPIRSATVDSCAQPTDGPGLGVRVLTEWIFTSDLRQYFADSQWIRKPQKEQLLHIVSGFPDRIDVKVIIDQLAQSIEKIHKSIGAELYRMRRAATEKVLELIHHRNKELPFHSRVYRKGENCQQGRILPVDCTSMEGCGPSCPTVYRMTSVCATSIPCARLEQLEYKPILKTLPRR